MNEAAFPRDAIQLVHRYYIYASIYTLAASVIWGINTLFLLDAGLTIGEVFTANAAFSIGTVLFEIPTGVVADTVGRRTSFLLSLGVLSLTTIVYVALAARGSGVIAFSVTSMLMGLGFTFYSGAMEAWLVDGLRATGYAGGLDQIFGRGQLFSGGAMLVGTVGGGAIGSIDLSLPFIVRSALLLGLAVLAFNGMHDLGFEPRRVTFAELPGEAAAVARAGVSYGWGRPALRLLMMSGAVQGGFFIWAWYAWQPYFLELLGRDAVWVAGVVAALLAASMMVGNGIVEIVMGWCGRRTTMLIWTASIFSVAMIGVGLVDAFVPAVALLCIAGLAMGIQGPVRQAFFHEQVPSRHRATVMSLDSLVSGLGGVGGQTSLGSLAERRGFSAGYVLGGAVTALAIPIAWMVRRRREDADYFTGTRAGAQNACAPQAIPAISVASGDIPAVTL